MGSGRKAHSVIFERSNAFLSVSVCGGSSPLVSRSFLCHSKRRQGTNRTRHYLHHLGPSVLIQGAIMTWQRQDTLPLLPGNYRDTEGGM